MSAPRDQVAAFDDMLTERHRTCLQCGRRAQHMELRIIGGRAWCVPRCARCVAEDPHGLAIEARLQAREEP
jgi:hypothetical protein